VARTAGSAADDTRQRILDIAVDLFIEQGYAGTSVRDISERLGMTKGSLYYHFASKEEVLNALVAPLLEDLDQFVLDAAAAGKIDRDLLERLVNLLDEHGVLLRSLMGDPSVLHGLTIRRSMPQRIAALQRSLADSDDAAAALRGRCALGVINAGAIAPRFDTVGADGSYARERAVRTRLSEQEKRFVVDAALAVLSVPV
jgi:AcrR family transcriptional regulator